MPETCRILYKNKIWIPSASGWLFKKKYITMQHGNMNVNLITMFGRKMQLNCELNKLLCFDWIYCLPLIN
jgi:hypothetical protein